MKKRHIWGLIIAILLIACYYTFNSATGDKSGAEIDNSAEIVQSDTVSTDGGQTEKPYKEYMFRTQKQLNEHYEKHGKEMGFSSAEEYLKAANAVVNSDKVLHKLEKEDNDDVYYIEDTNEFVIVSGQGYIRTYFNPDDGIDYFNRQ